MVSKQRNILLVVLLVVALMLGGMSSAAAQSAKPTQPTAGNKLQAATFTLDGVRIEVDTPALPNASFSSAAAGDTNQLALATAHQPYRELSVLAVPYGLGTGFERLPQAKAGVASTYRTSLAQYRKGQGATPQDGPTVTIFDQATVGLVSLVNLNLDSATAEPTLIVEWVAEAGNRVWLVRYASEQASSDLDLSRIMPDGLRSLTLRSNNLDTPTTVITNQSPTQQKTEQVTQPNDVPTPSWWTGDCDYTHYYNGSGGRGSYRLGAVYKGMPACGPRPISDRAPDVLVQFFPGSGGAYEWECVELSLRWLYQNYGVNPYSGNGSQMVWNYSGTALQKISNGTTGKAPQPDDVLSYGSTATNGHTSVVTSSSVDGNGNGSITVIEENNSANGSNTLYVNGWYVSNGVSGWLHSPSSGGGNGCNGTDCNGLDPVDTSCVNGAYTTRSMDDYYNGKHYTIELRWSPSCRTNWSRITVDGASTLEAIVRDSSSTYLYNTYRQVDGSTITWSRMYYAPAEAVSACGAVDWDWSWHCTDPGLNPGEGANTTK